MRVRPNKKGFTLVELLVVISIISLLSSIVLASVAVAKKKANVALAVEEIHELGNALSLYDATYINSMPQGVGSNYPVPDFGDGAFITTSDSWNSFSSKLNPLTGNPKFISTIPQPPASIAWKGDGGIYFGYEARPAGKGVTPPGVYYTCGNTPFGDWTLVIYDAQSYKQLNAGTTYTSLTPYEYDFTDMMPGPVEYFNSSGTLTYIYYGTWCITGS